MKRVLLRALVLLLGAAAPLSAQLRITARAADLTVGGLLQTQYSISSVSGTGRTDAVDDFFVRRARLQVDLRIGALDARVEPDFGGGGVGVGPADLFARLTLTPALKLSVGQFKRAFSIFELVSDTDLPTVERDARIEGVNHCPGGVGGSCSFSRIAQRLQYDERDIGLRIEGDLGSRLQYQATLTNGQGRNNPDVNDAKSPSARLTFGATPSVRLSAFGAMHDYVGTTSPEVPNPPTRYARAGGVDLEVGTWRRGLHLLAAGIGGDNWLGGTAARFWAAEAMASLYVPLPDGGTLAGIEPMLRLDRTSVDDVPGGLGSMETLTLTPGIALYVSGKNWLGINLDWYHPSDAPGVRDDWSLKSQMYFYF